MIFLQNVDKLVDSPRAVLYIVASEFDYFRHLLECCDEQTYFST